MRGLDRRVGTLEARLKPLPPAAYELWRDVPRALSFEEIELGQRALEPFAGDPVAAVKAGDPTMTALVVVARARRGGQPVPELFA